MHKALNGGVYVVSEYIRRLQKLPRTASAHLRRATGTLPDVPAEAYPFLPAVPEGVEEPAELVHHQVAILYTQHPANNTGVSIPSALRRYTQIYPAATGMVEKRFTAILDAQSDVTRHLLWAVKKLAQAQIAIDWSLLLQDLLAWDDIDRTTQRRWAREFWSNPSVNA